MDSGILSASLPPPVPSGPAPQRKQTRSSVGWTVEEACTGTQPTIAGMFCIAQAQSTDQSIAGKKEKSHITKGGIAIYDIRKIFEFVGPLPLTDFTQPQFLSSTFWGPPLPQPLRTSSVYAPLVRNADLGIWKEGSVLPALLLPRNAFGPAMSDLNNTD